MREETYRTAELETKEPTIFVDSVRFVGAPHLSPDRAHKLIAWIKALDPYGEDDDWWIKAFAEYITHELHEEGYYQSEVRCKYRVLKTKAKQRHIELISLVKEGIQYHLGDLHFEGNNAFPGEQLRQLIPLQRGDVFDVSKVVDGLSAIERLYGSHGFIDMTPEVATNIQDNSTKINLTVGIDEQEPYHIQEVEVLGPDPKTEDLIRSDFKAGEIFDRTALDSIFSKYRAVLPADASERDVEILRDSKNRLISIRLNFQTCPTLPN